jgi:hypothetical protein
MSGLCTGQTGMLRKEKKAQVSSPQKEPTKKEPKKKK